MRSVTESDVDDAPSWSLWLVAAICFGPAALLCLLGVLALPVWFTMLSELLARPERFAHDPGATVWNVAVPIAYVISGLIGLLGLGRVLTLPGRERPRSHRIFTIGMVAVGLAALVFFSLPLTLDDFSEGIPADLVVLVVLPFAGAAWVLSKTWRALIAAPRAKP